MLDVCSPGNPRRCWFSSQFVISSSMDQDRVDSVFRVRELKWLLAKYKLVGKLSSENKKMLGL